MKSRLFYLNYILKELTICEFNQMAKLIDGIQNISLSLDINIKARTGNFSYPPLDLHGFNNNKSVF